MASIAFLLNPQEDQYQYQQLPSPCSTSYTGDHSSNPRQKKPKLSKDAAVFMRGKIKGELRYPPCEYQNEELAKAHREFQLHPMGQITEFPRHIPYNSDKKSFMEKTGRGSFEVFQYTFKVPGHEKTYIVMWDYNIGLVRTTSLFKCNNYSKTTPAKMLNSNPGLRDVCHSITGGALAAQGYWMPFEAAKAVAATFCWHIRHVLTPIFGVDFLSLCLPPDDPNFGRMTISASVIQTATETANYYRRLENPQLDASPSIPSPQTPVHPNGCRDGSDAKTTRYKRQRGEMGSEESEENCTTPTPYWNNWTPANVSQSSKPCLPTVKQMLEKPPQREAFRKALPLMTIPSNSHKNRRLRKKDIVYRWYTAPGSSSFFDGDGDLLQDQWSSETEQEEEQEQLENDDDDKISLSTEKIYDDGVISDDDDDSLPDGPSSGSESLEEQQRRLTRDTKAAHMLLQLHMQDREIGCDNERKRRRASA